MKADMEKEKKEKNDDPGRVRVFIRLKPCQDQEQAVYNITVNGNQLHVPDTQGKIDQDRWYKFDRIYSTNSSNRDVYKKVGNPLVDGALNGFNGALFAYGQSGSGKTHTLMSKDGMTAHMVSDLFNRMWNDPSYEYKVTCSYLQIYQERIYDLLNSNPKLEFNIREDAQNGTFVENISSYICHSPTDVYELLNIGRKRLVFGETRMNRLSSSFYGGVKFHTILSTLVVYEAIWDHNRYDHVEITGDQFKYFRSHAVCQLVIERKRKDKSEEEIPIEVSSPKHNKPTIEIPELDFETIPFRKTNLKKRHSIAVSKPTKRNSGSNLSLSTKKLRANNDNELTSPGRNGTDGLHLNASKNLQKRYSINLDRRPYSPGTLSPRSHTPELNSNGAKSIKKRYSVNLDRRPYSPGAGALSPRSHTPEPNLFRSATTSSFRSLKRISVNLEEGANRLSIRRSSRPETPPDLSNIESFMLSNDSFLSNELSISTDSVIDDMQWQMEASTQDISKIFDQEFAKSEEDEAFGDLSFTGDETREEEESDVTSDSIDNILLRGKLSIVFKRKNPRFQNVVELLKMACFVGVDLAGSERVKKSKAAGDRLNEAQHINLSLLELGNVISALADDNRTHVPYRNSMLTRLLQDSLGGNCKTSFILCSSTSMDDLHETKCTLEFGQRLLKVTTQPKVNVEVDYKHLCEELQFKLANIEDVHKKSLAAMETQLSILQGENQKLEEDLIEERSLSITSQQQLNTSNDKMKDMQSELDNMNKKYTLHENILKRKNTELIITKKEHENALQKRDDQINEYENKLKKKDDDLKKYENVLKKKDDEIRNEYENKLKKKDDELNEYENRLKKKDDELRSEYITVMQEKDIELRNEYENSLKQTDNELLELKKELELLLQTDQIKATPVKRESMCDVATNTASRVTTSPIRVAVETNTSPIHSFIKKFTIDRSITTSPVLSASCATSPIHDLKSIEFERMRNVLLAELMSLQLLYSMFDLTIHPDTETKSIDEETNSHKKDCLHEDKGHHSPTSSTPSGYETGSHSQLDIHKNISERIGDVNLSRNVTPDYFKFPIHESPLHDTEMLNKFKDSYTPKTGGLLEEIIEAQLSGCFSSPSSVSLLPIEDRISFLRREISTHKKSIDAELAKLANELLENNQITEEGGRVQKRGVYSKLVQKLSDPDSCVSYNIEQFEQILNLVLVDHSLTGCLLALSHKRKNKNTDMMRRLSSIKSNPKSLLDYIDIDQELCGYENEAVVFQDDDEDLDSVDNIMEYTVPHTFVQPKTEALNNIDSEASEISSDSECGSPTPQKKGLRRFFCMPMKSMKGSKNRKSFRKKKSTKQTSLLECED